MSLGLCHIGQLAPPAPVSGSSSEPRAAHAPDMSTIFIVLLLLALLWFAWFVVRIPLLWYLLAAALFFAGHLGPAFGCLVFGALASLFALARSD